jgi:hypothetical protein
VAKESSKKIKKQVPVLPKDPLPQSRKKTLAKSKSVNYSKNFVMWNKDIVKPTDLDAIKRTNKLFKSRPFILIRNFKKSVVSRAGKPLNSIIENLQVLEDVSSKETITL